jgi:hypothetical protein
MRAGIVSELLKVLSALEIRDASGCVFAGRRYEAGADGSFENPDASPLVSLLHGILYQQAYARRFGDGPSETVQLSQGMDMPAALAAANNSRDRWVSDWRISHVFASGQIAAHRYGVQRVFWPGEFISAEAAGGPPQPGATVNVLWKGGSAAAQPGFYFSYGETIPDQIDEYPLVRFYMNIRPGGAARILEYLGRTLNRFRIPFRYKCLSKVDLYPRADAGVLYIGRRFYNVCSELMSDMHKKIGSELGANVPLFSLYLSPGIGLAEDPGTGESFGMNRCRIVAQGIADAFSKNLHSAEGRLKTVEDRFKAVGLDLQRPHLNPGSSNEYSWPEA